MKFEIELDEINTYRIIVEADCETTAEIAGITQTLKSQPDRKKKTSAMLDIRQQEGTPNLSSKFYFPKPLTPSKVITKVFMLGA